MKCMHIAHAFFSVSCSIQLLKKDTLNPEITILHQFHDQKALLKVPKICNINFWIENAPPPFRNFSKNSSVLEMCGVPNANSISIFSSQSFIYCFYFNAKPLFFLIWKVKFITLLIFHIVWEKSGEEWESYTFEVFWWNGEEWSQWDSGLPCITL